MERDEETRLKLPIQTAVMSFFIPYPSKKFLAILKSGRLGSTESSVSLKRDEFL
jgi:hypothetical protein